MLAIIDPICTNVAASWQEMERLFCPTCGNAALQKVEVAIGENGAEQYGVRKRHIIRGSRVSLPKPKVPISLENTAYASFSHSQRMLELMISSFV